MQLTLGADTIPLHSARLVRGLGLQAEWELRAGWDSDGTGSTGRALNQASFSGQALPAILDLDGQQLTGWVFAGAWMDRKMERKGPVWIIRLIPSTAWHAPRRFCQQGNLLDICRSLGLTARGGPDDRAGLPSLLQQEGNCTVIVEGLDGREAAEYLMNDFRRRWRQQRDARQHTHLAVETDGTRVWALHREAQPRGLEIPERFTQASWSAYPVTSQPQERPLGGGATMPTPGMALRTEWSCHNAQEFEAWSQVILPAQWNACPAFGGRALLVHRMADSFKMNAQGQLIWRTVMETFPTPPPAPSLQGFPAWSGLATCRSDAPDKEGMVWVELEGFAPSKLRTRLFSLYTALPGNPGGLNLPPAMNSTVLIHWSGRCEDMPICLGNVRLALPASPAHFLDLPAGSWQARVAETLDVQSGKEVTVTTQGAILLKAPNVKVQVGQTMEVTKE